MAHLFDILCTFLMKSKFSQRLSINGRKYITIMFCFILKIYIKIFYIVYPLVDTNITMPRKHHFKYFWKILKKCFQ